MNRINRYFILFVVLITFSFLKVYALDVSLTDGETYIVSSAGKNSLKCDASSKDGYFASTKNNNNDYVVRYAGENRATEVSDTLSCTYKNRSKDLSLTLNLSYSPTEHVSGTIVVDDTAIGSIINLSDFISEGTIVSKTAESGSDRFDFSGCTGSSVSACVIKALYPAGSNTEETVHHKLNIRFKNANSSVESILELTVYFKPRSKYYAAGGGYGTCNWSDYGWTKSDRANYYASSVDSDGKITLPKCNSNNSSELLIEFSNWVAGDNASTGAEFVVSKCNKSGFETFAAEQAFTPGANRQFWACYEYISGVMLYANGGIINDNNWTYQSSTGVYYAKGTSLKLPNVVAPNGKYFTGWRSSNADKLYKAGETITVSSAVSLTAEYKKQTDYEGTINMNVGEKNILSVASDVKSCSSSNKKYATASAVDAACAVEALKANNLGDPEVKITIETVNSNEKYVYNLIIIDNDLNMTENVNYDAYGYIIGAGASVVYGDVYLDPSFTESQNVGSTSPSYPSSCTVSATGDRSDIDGVHGIPHFSSSGCGSSSTVCLDPSRNAPANGTSCTVTGVYSGMGSIWDAGIDAATIAARVWAIANGVSTSDGPWGGNYDFYAAAAATGDFSGFGEYAAAAEAAYNAMNANGGAGYGGGGGGGQITRTKAANKSSFKWNNPSNANAGFTYVEEGTISAPVSDFTVICSSTSIYDCTVNLSGSGSTKNYKITITTKPGQTKKLKTINIPFSVNYTISFPAVTLMLDCGASSQKMLTDYQPDSKTVSKTFNVTIAGRCVGNDPNKPIYSYLNPSNCAKENNCINNINNYSFNEVLFKEFGCCVFANYGDNYAYNEYCLEGCTYSTYSPVCRSDGVGDANGRETYVIHEAAAKNESYKNKNGDYTERYSCIIDINNTKKTDAKTDDAGNSVSLAAFRNNSACRVSCKEDWEFKLPTYSSFVGNNAIAAGTYFAIDNNMEIIATRTCVTTRISGAQVNINGDGGTYSGSRAEAENQAKWEVERAKNNGGVSNPDSYVITTGECRYSAVMEVNGKKYYSDGNSEVICSNSDSAYNSAYEEALRGVEKTLLESGKNRDVVKAEAKKTVDKVKTNNNPKVSEYKDNCTNYANMFVNDKMYYFIREADNCSTSAKAKQSAYEVALLGVEESLLDDGVEESTAKTRALEIVDAAKSTTGQSNPTVYETDGICKYYAIMKVKDKNYDSVRTDEICSSKDLAKQSAIDEAIREIANGYLDNVDDDFIKMYASEAEVAQHNSDVEACKNFSVDNYFDPDIIFSYDDDFYMKLIGDKNKLRIIGDVETTTSEKFYSDITNKNKYTGTETNKASAQFVKRSVTKRAIFGAGGNWYIHFGSDIKSYGENLQAAINKVGGTNDGKWSLYGKTNAQVFPISLNTRRNFYQYVYTFTNIGAFNDGTLGRIMGGTLQSNQVVGRADSIIPVNKFTCFYEVYEGICKCCGDPINSYTVSSGLHNYISDNDYSAAYNLSNKESVTKGGSLGFYSSIVDLSDLTAGSNRLLAANWKAGTPYLVGGEVVRSNQGKGLADYVQGVGDNIYNKDPEYSYTLSPGAVSEIRDYNDKNGYELNANKMKDYGSVRFVSKTDDWDISDKTKQPNFSHYGSIFLETNLSKYITEKYKDKIKTSKNKVCDIDSRDSIYEIFTTSTSWVSDCRWIDYIVGQTYDKDGNVTNDTPSTKYRLAFK